MEQEDGGTDGAPEGSGDGQRPGRRHQWLWVCAGFVGVYMVIATAAWHFGHSVDSPQTVLVSGSSASATPPATPPMPTPVPNAIGATQAESTCQVSMSCVNEAISEVDAEPALSQRDWPLVLSRPDDYMLRRAELDVQVVGILAGTANQSLTVFTDFPETNPFNSSIVNLPFGMAPPRPLTFWHVTGTVLASINVQLATGAQYTTARVEASTMTQEACADAFSSDACVGFPASVTPTTA